MRIDRIKLTVLLTKKDMTVKELAEKVGLSRATVTAVKRGKSCTLVTAGKLAAGLGVDVSEIIERETE